MRRFPMSLSPSARWITGVAGLVLCAIPVAARWLLPVSAVGPARWALLLPPGILLASWMLSPCAIEIGRGELRIRRRAWRAAAYPLSRIDRAELLPPGWARGLLRTFGNGGLFGFYGWFYRAGPVRLFATRTDGLIEIGVGGSRVVVSPDEPARFVEALIAVAPRAKVRPADRRAR